MILLSGIRSHEELLKYWTNEWNDLFDDIDESHRGDLQETFKDQLSLGESERAIAGDHQGREVIELLQNARDAIEKGGTEGRVYIGVCEKGLLVANTGAPFNFQDKTVERSATGIGKTSKGAGGTIGHKGVGLKSVLARGDAFEVWTETNDLLRVRFSRAPLVAVTLDRLGIEHDTSLPEVPSPFTLPEQDRHTDPPSSLGDSDRDAIADLPLFRYPIPLTTEARLSPIAKLARELVAGSAGETDLLEPGLQGSFRTAVFVEYSDPEWRTLLEQLDCEPDHLSVPADPESTWSRVAGEGSHRGIEAETLVQLGHIDEVILDPVFDGSDERDRLEWTICTDSDVTIESEAFEHRRVVVTRRRNNSNDQLTFDQFASDGPHHTKLLTLRTKNGEVPDDRTPYPPYLYYPVENVDPLLPVCLHGRFEVTTNRQQLSENELKHNKEVLEKAIDLIAAVAAATANHQLDSTDQADTIYPWLLLPDPPDETILTELAADAEPTDNPTTLLTWFRHAVYDRLADTACLPAVDGTTHTPDTSQILLHWDRPVLDGLQSVYPAYNAVGEAQDDHPDLIAPPPQRSLAAAAAIDEAIGLEARLEQLLIDTREAGRDSINDEVTGHWVRLLSAFLTRKKRVRHVECPAPAARNILHATATLLAPSDSERGVEDRIEEYESLDGVYLFPCQSGKEDTLFLVPVERQRRRESGGMVALKRTILWNTHTGETDLSPPPADAQFRVYFLDEAVQGREGVARLLSAVGRRWGIRDYRDQQLEYYRSLLDSFATETDTGEKREAKVPALSFIADRIDAFVGKEMARGPGSYLRLDVLSDALDSVEQRGNLRQRLRLRHATLSVENGTVPIQDLQLGPEALKLLDEEATGLDSLPVDDTTVLDPTTTKWHEVREHDYLQISGVDADQAIAETLSLLGVDALPGLRVHWPYGDIHPRTDRASFHWNPFEWSVIDENRLDELHAHLRACPDYLKFITGPGLHPAESGRHTSQGCDGRLQAGDETEGAKLASWPYLTDPDRFTDGTLCAYLRAILPELDDSLLWTGWYCDRDHTLRTWSDPVPSLLNWQLRTRYWDDLVEPPRNDTILERWDEDWRQLRWAVQADPQDRISQLLPTIDPDDPPLPTELLHVLGVRPIDDLTPVAAADRLQKLQSVLADEPLTADADVPLRFPDRLESHWRQAYTDLLQPILNHLDQREDGPAPDLLEYGVLTHLPIRQDQHRTAARCTKIADATADDIRYLTESSPPPWVEHEAENYRLLERPNRGTFSALTDTLELKPVDANRPIIPTEELDTVTDVDRGGIQASLYDRLEFLIAALEPTDEDQIQTYADRLRAAIEDLLVVESLTEEQEAQLFDASARLHGSQDRLGLVINQDRCGTDTAALREGCAIGIALLFERIAQRDVLQRALRLEPDEELRREWRDRGFPIRDVRAVLGNRAVHELDRRLNDLDALLAALDQSPVDRSDSMSDILGEADPSTIEWVKGTFADPAPADNLADDLTHNDTEAIRTLAKTYADRFAPPTDPIPGWIIQQAGATYADWHDLIYETESTQMETAALIDWLDEHPHYIADGGIRGSVREQWRRLAAVIELWHETEPERFTDTDWLVQALRSFGQLPDIAPSDRVQHGVQTLRGTPDKPDEPLVTDGAETDDTLPSRWFYVADSTRLQTALLEPLLDQIAERDADRRRLLESFVLNGDLGEETMSGAKQRQRTAFDGFESQATSVEADIIVDSGDLTPEDTAPVATGSSGGSAGGGSTNYTGRGEQAEVYVMGQVLLRLKEWLADERPNSRLVDLLEAFDTLYTEQQEDEHDYKWHVNSRWERELLPLIERGFATKPYLEFPQHSSDRPLRELPFVQLINVTQEQGPGFDVIDPFGPISTGRIHSEDELAFLPVEVKAVDEQQGFRFTTNEFRRCQAFVEAGIPYAIRLVEMPDGATEDWVEQASIVAEYLFGNKWLNPSDIVETSQEETTAETLAKRVRGGYLTLGPE